MGMMDDFFGKAKDVADVAAAKTGKVVEKSKLKLKAVQLNGQIKDTYGKLGSAVYTMEKEHYSNDALIHSLIQEVDELKEELAAINHKIAEVSNIIFCDCCGAKNHISSRYCSKCGNKLVVDFDGFDGFVKEEPEQDEDLTDQTSVSKPETDTPNEA